MLTTNQGIALKKNGAGSGAAELSTSYSSGTATNVRGASSIKLRLYAALGGTATAITFRVLDTSPSSDATIGAQSFPIRFVRESDGTAASSHEFSANGVETLLVNLGGAFETITVQAKGTTGSALAAGDIAIAEVTVGEGAR